MPRTLTLRSILLCAALLFAAPDAVCADVYVSAGASRGQAKLSLRKLVSPFGTSRATDLQLRPTRRWGFSGRGDYEATFKNRWDVDVKSYNFRAMAKLVAFPERLSPYAGIGIGVNFVESPDDDLKQAYALESLEYFGMRAAAVGFAGIMLPVGEHLSFFTEGRVAGAFLLTDRDKVAEEALQSAGVTGMAGLRVEF